MATKMMYRETCMVLLLVTNLSIKAKEQTREIFDPPVLDDYLNAIPNLSTVSPEWNMTTDQIIRYHGYPVEEHSIVTSDGYIIRVQRIPYGKTKNKKALQNPVILQHGFLITSSAWVLNVPTKNLAYKLADAGYDVWLTNVRGNTYGLKHRTLSIYNDKFWRFSFHEMGIYDLTAMVDYILNITGSKQVDFVGYSMGNAVFSIMLSTVPQYNQKVRIGVLLAPALSMRYTTNILRELTPLFPVFELMEGQMLPLNFPIIRIVASQFCQTQARDLCNMILLSIFGLNHNQRNMSRFPVYFSHLHDVTSFQTMLHYLQVRNNIFQMYDYGSKKNYKIYGQNNPPKYELEKIATPLVIVWSDYDIFANPQQMSDILHRFPSLLYDYRVPSDRFSHTDYLISDEADKLVYDKVLEILENLTKT